MMLASNKMQQIPFIGLLNQRNVFRATNSPILRGTYYNAQLLVQCTDIAADR
jgi:hypothetical protein